MSQERSNPKVRVIKSVASGEQTHATIPAGRRDSVLQKLSYIETQVGRLRKMAREIRAELTAK